MYESENSLKAKVLIGTASVEPNTLKQLSKLSEPSKLPKPPELSKLRELSEPKLEID